MSSSDLFGVTQQRIDHLKKDFNTAIMEMESEPLEHVREQLRVSCTFSAIFWRRASLPESDI
jgi:hypothetical protein